MDILVTSIVDVYRSPNTRLHHFLEGLAEWHDITIICPYDSWRSEQTDVEKYGSRMRIVQEETDVHHLMNRPVSPIAQEVLSEVLVRRLDVDFRKYDVHFDYNTLCLGRAVAKRVRRGGGRVVYDLADDIGAMVRESPQLPFPLDRIGGAFAERVLQRNLDKADCVTHISDAIGEHADLDPERSQVIPNGVDTTQFVDGLSTDGIETPGTRYVVGYVGTNREWVALGRVLEAVATLRGEGIDVGLLVVGEEGGIDHLVRRGRELGIADACSFPGTVPYEEVPVYMNAMDIGTIPFVPGEIADNSSPLKLFEYMACSLPVVSTRLRGVEEAAGDRVTYVDDGECVSACRALLSSPDRRRELGRRGRALVESEYSWRRQIESLNECLVEVA